MNKKLITISYSNFKPTNDFMQVLSNVIKNKLKKIKTVLKRHF